MERKYWNWKFVLMMHQSNYVSLKLTIHLNVFIYLFGLYNIACFAFTGRFTQSLSVGWEHGQNGPRTLCCTRGRTVHSENQTTDWLLHKRHRRDRALILAVDILTSSRHHMCLWHDSCFIWFQLPLCWHQISDLETWSCVHRPCKYICFF